MGPNFGTMKAILDFFTQPSTDVIIEDTLGMFKEFISSQTVRKTIILPITISKLTE